MGEEEESELGRFLADENTVAPEMSAETSLREQALRDLLDQLSYRERRVLELRYGLRGEKPRTLDELGRMFNVTRERIRQVEPVAPEARRAARLGPPRVNPRPRRDTGASASRAALRCQTSTVGDGEWATRS